MKARLTGVPTWQGTPSGGDLYVYPLGRYEDGNGNASVGRLHFTLDVAGRRWQDALSPGADAYLVVAATGEPTAIRAEFDETIHYANQPSVRTIFERALVATDLGGTTFDYTQPQGVRAWVGAEPITMQAARQLIAQGPLLEQGAALVRAAMRIDGTVAKPGQLPADAPVDARYFVESTGTIWVKAAQAWQDTHYSASNLAFGTRAQRRLYVPTAATQWAETDTGVTVTFVPGIGWRDASGGNPEAAPPPPDTGAY